MLLRILTRMHSSCIINYTCQHICIRNILCHIHASRIDRGDNVAGVQRRRGRGPTEDSSSRSSQRRGVDIEEILECPDHHPTSFLKGKPRSILTLLVFYKILLESFMIDALGYKSWLEPLDAYNSLSRNTPLTLCRSRIEYMLSHA